MSYDASSTEPAPVLDLPQKRLRPYAWLSTAPFFAVHLLCFAAIWTGVYWRDIAICVGLYFIRMFAVTGVYHRYFSHRSYKTSRVMQFLLAFLAQSSAQRGVLWWAGWHRHHHKHSDQHDDAHSPRHDGFWWSHLGWFLLGDTMPTDEKIKREYKDYPEILWLDRQPHVAVVAMGALVWLFAGWSGLVVGFFWSTVLLWHGTFTINSLSHVIGSRRYETKDDSRNNLFLALLTMGEGWHNNHHHYQSSTRQGFFWWEIDMTYYILKMMSWVGLVWDLREPPKYILEKRSKHEATTEPAPTQEETGSLTDLLPGIPDVVHPLTSASSEPHCQ